MVRLRFAGKCREGGFSLIELMTTIAIMAFLALLGAPLTRDWVDGTKQMQARNALLEGVGYARALALRNPLHLADDAPIALLRVSRGRAHIDLTGVGTAWQTDLPSSVNLKTAGKADFGSVDAFASSSDVFTCVAFNSRGVRLPAATDCLLPLTEERIAIGVRSKEPLYVEIL